MNLVTANVKGKDSLGVLAGEDVILLREAYACLLARRGEQRSQEVAQATIPNSMIEFIQAADRSLEVGRECLDFVDREGLQKRPSGDGVVAHKGGYRLMAPVPRPPSVYVVAVNNRRAFQASLGKNVSGNPLVCMKAPSSVIGDEEAIVIPGYIKHAGPECELGVVIGREARHASKEEALNYVFGYTMVDDVTAYDMLYEDVLVHGPLPHERKPGAPAEATGRFTYGAFRAKSHYSFTPMGPSIATKDSISPEDVEIWCDINGERLQHGRTNNYAFSVADLIAFLSRVIPLVPGDIISMGRVSPEHRDLKDGDTLVCHAEGIGTLHHPVRVETRG